MKGLSMESQQASSERRSKITTLEDVAVAAGVSPMTVSRVMKGQKGVGPATRERVLEVVEQLNYTANHSARALRSGRTGIIAVISGNLSHDYFSKTALLLEAQITSSGYQMRLLYRDGDLEDLAKPSNASAVDGVIVIARYPQVEEFRSPNPKAFPPCVFIGAEEYDDADHICIDFCTPVTEALDIMWKAGRKRLAFYRSGIYSFEQTQSEVRQQTYVAMMEKVGCQPRFFAGSKSRDPGDSWGAVERQYLDQHGCPDGIVCFNDEDMIFVSRILYEKGFRVPTDVMIVGCDAHPHTKYFQPSLSTIAQPMPEICARAWSLLQNRLAEPEAQFRQERFTAGLIVRESLQA
ncbi:LacI family transcriptional regulator [bacterium]|nr:MAG: LacI family transcriptional regulator [bacterium]